MLATLAVDGGHRVVALDRYGDLDLRELCDGVSLERDLGGRGGLAALVLAAGGVRSAEGRRAVAAFDASLRDATNALNPGTTADLVAATLFVALLENMI